MSSPRPGRTVRTRTDKQQLPAAARVSGGPVRVDAALRQTVALLELVGQEEALLGWLDDCVAQLRAVRRARQTLLDFTDFELSEARDHATTADDADRGPDAAEIGAAAHRRSSRPAAGPGAATRGPKAEDAYESGAGS